MASVSVKQIICLGVLLMYWAVPGGAVTIQGARTNQVIEGFGANVNYRSWNGSELQPVLDALIDEAGMTIFRVVYDLTDWEASNDNTNADLFNWSYYNGVYRSTEFTRLWNMFAYLNSRGITNGAFFNFMGGGPGWMIQSDGSSGTLKSGMEPEWAEMITSMLVYARNTMGLQFSLVAPDNEPNSISYPEGIHIPTAKQYTNALHKLALRLDSAGMGDVGLVGPDVAGGGTTYMPEMMADPVIMAKLKHFGLHDYSSGGGSSSSVSSYIADSAYPDRTLWLTEFTEWCAECENGVRGTNSWSFARGIAEDLLSYLANGAAGTLVWEGYDSRYAHGPAYGGVSGTNKWSYWGLFAVDNPTNAVKTYTARKQFYTHAQVSKWVSPGSQRVGITGSTSSFSPLLAFKHTGLGQVTIVGVNTSSIVATLRGTNYSLPTVPRFSLYYTSATTNLAYGGNVPVTNGTFSATIPADCVFTLTYTAPSPLVVTTTDLPSAVVGETYSSALTASGGVPPYIWSVASNAAAPAGLTLSTNGILSGVPASVGLFDIPVVVTDSANAQASQEVSLEVMELVVVLDAPTQSSDEIGDLGFRLKLLVNIPGTYMIQRTSDFGTWEDVQEVLCTNGAVEVTNHNSIATSAQFYRAYKVTTAP